MISYEEFKKVEMRIGKVISAEKIPGAKKLLRLVVDFGNEKRQAVSGIADQYKPEDLIGKKFAFVVNLEPRKFMGVESQCMILAAEKDGKVALLAPVVDIEEGAEIL